MHTEPRWALNDSSVSWAEVITLGRWQSLGIRWAPASPQRQTEVCRAQRHLDPGSKVTLLCIGWETLAGYIIMPLFPHL